MTSSKYSKPVVGGVSQVKSWGPTLTVADALALLGRNSGNMMFTESICRVLHDALPTSFSLADSVLEGRDSIVLAAANWVNEFDDFGWLASIVERTKLPVFLIGVGAQASLDMSIPNVKPGTLRLLKIVAERSTAIAARGEFSCEVLNHYGIKSAMPTGCPSLLLAGRDGPGFSKPANADRVVLHATRHGFGRCDGFQGFLYQQAMAQGFDILLQSEDADIYFALGRTNNPDILARATDAVRLAYGTPDVDAISAYLRAHGLFYTDFATWIRQMTERSFCMGTRIHGTIASIIARTPAVLIAHDSRTLEMARTMNIPHVLSSEVPTDRPLDISAFLDRSAPEKLISGYAAYRARYMEFFAKNGLTTAATA